MLISCHGSLDYAKTMFPFLDIFFENRHIASFYVPGPGPDVLLFLSCSFEALILITVCSVKIA
jgi:hypothetical protein